MSRKVVRVRMRGEGSIETTFSKNKAAVVPGLGESEAGGRAVR